eukprot:5782249-Heterocapsa_arctica.AAC.1
MVPPMEYEHDEVAVCIDPSLEGIPMVKVTPAFFTHFGGPSLKKNTCLLSWVPKRDEKLLKASIQEA